MDKEHRAKVTEALKVCESAFDHMCKLIDKNIPDTKVQSNLKYFLMNQTFFAGGLFRSIFTGTPVNDIDIFFSSEDAALEFRHLFMRDARPLLAKTEISKQFTFYFPRKTQPKISFITAYAGNPQDVLRTFDFSFNRHFFVLGNYTMQFDVDTFSKLGGCDSQAYNEPLDLLLRLMRFEKEGFTLEGNAKANILFLAMGGVKGCPYDHKEILTKIQGPKLSAGESEEKKAPRRSYQMYTEESFFNVQEALKPTKKLYATATGTDQTFQTVGGTWTNTLLGNAAIQREEVFNRAIQNAQGGGGMAQARIETNTVEGILNGLVNR